ncbi:hypothetical protein SHKM778_34650 [Streptomyces sp. KM77-8]|uniref:Molecular chaperone DnaK n=1 Tax=Streptomyces haneummycinicus TaxID=3074435 RepID=A0AAT9HHW8_9ACTN
MMRDAEQYADEDRKRRETAETRNQAEQLAYQTERFLQENGDKVPGETRAEVEAAVETVKGLLDGDASELRAAVEKLGAVSQRMGQAMYAGASETSAPPTEEPQDDGVVDAEIVDDDKNSTSRQNGAA